MKKERQGNKDFGKKKYENRCKKSRITERKTSLEVIIYTQADVKFTANHTT
jgi:hypothetical protein